MPNWKLIRTEYETLHTGLKELASSHQTSEALIQVAIKEGDWKHLGADDMDTDGLSSRLAAMDIRHQAELVPRFISLQALMLDKCSTLLENVSTLDDANNLKIVSEVIEKHRPNIMGVKKDGANDNAMTIRIMNKVGDGPDVSVSAVEITASAGETNGLGSIERLN